LSAKLMANRSDRHLKNLSNFLALEAVVPIRKRRADFHQGPECQTELLYRGRIYDRNRLRFTPANNFTRGAGSIYESSNPFRSANQARTMLLFLGLVQSHKQLLSPPLTHNR